MEKAITLLLLTLLACQTTPLVPEMMIGDKTYQVELATTPQQWETGLMYRESMAKDSGMLFIFPDEQPRAFWMKNTLIPLDMIFIDEQDKIVKIHRDVPPCEADPCPSYTSPPARYVLELSANQSLRLRLGDQVEIP